MASKKKPSSAKKQVKRTGKTSATSPTAAPVGATLISEPAVATLTARVEGSRDRSTIVGLVAKLRDCDAEAARDAATMLGCLPADAEAVDALCDVVINRDGYFHSVVRTSAAAALGRLGDRRAVDALIAGIHDTMAEASEEAVQSLGLLGDPRALPALDAVIANPLGFFLENVRRTADAAAARIRSAA